MAIFTKTRIAAVAAAALAVGACAGIAAGGQDIGLLHEELNESHSNQAFGIKQGLEQSSAASLTGVQINADPTAVATLAEGLHAEVVTSGVAAPNIDMMVPWPNNTDPTHLIVCNEQGQLPRAFSRSPWRQGLLQQS